MDIDTRLLDILFRKVSPSHILQRLRRPGSVIDITEDRNLFRRVSATCLDGYSLDEQALIFSRLQTEAAKFAGKASKAHASSSTEFPITDLPLPALAFYSVLSFSNRILTQQSTEPVCKIEHVLPWRETFLLLGQDLFVCAYLAWEDLCNHYTRLNFAWPAVIRTNHTSLNSILKQGVAENHQHLYGSSQTFALSWCNLMNYPDSHNLIGRDFDQLYQPFVVSNKDDSLFSTKERVRYACICRSHLFQWLRGENQSCINCCNSNSTNNASLNDCICPKTASISNCYHQKLWAWVNEFRPDVSVLNKIRFLRVFYGAEIPQPDGSVAQLDYALTKDVFQATPNAHYRSLAGERNFLYSCFKSFFSGEMDNRTQLVFYLYIILKALFRSELIQANKQTGFRNFSNYQDRKTELCDRPCYWAELIRMAINAPLAEGAVSSLETRIVPRDTAQKNLQRIKETDSLKLFADLDYAEYEYSKITVESVRSNTAYSEYFYVVHFIKRPDDDPQCLSALNLTCRHQKLRNELQHQAVALVKTLSSSKYFSQRIRGIDCASHEIGCPPEVFATIYRYLRNYHLSEHLPPRLFSTPSFIQLAATYHAGEDFLDIASALRSIDEAVIFLGLHRGDRIGHALGLGVEPEIHYALKGKRIFIPKQDRLDDLVWLLYRSRELGLHIDAHLYGMLKKEAEILLLDIYGDAIYENNWHVSLTEYYCSMQLRADDPELYISMTYKPSAGLFNTLDDFRCSSHTQGLERYRHTPSLAGMYYYYHFGKREKVRGNQICEVIIDTQYIHLIRTAQDALQKELAQKGIVIECNPSSNVLIGTFGQYNKHPIFRFNNTDLERDNEKYQQCSQLQVCINTDDLGVFDTSQEFEYALLYQALHEMCDTQGNPLYKESDILRYLNNIREMGQTAVF